MLSIRRTTMLVAVLSACSSLAAAAQSRPRPAGIRLADLSWVEAGKVLDLPFMRTASC
ncbi:MAG: hypothetical protein V4550_10545 [Gemmatimonadota bacterium]